MKTKKIPLCLVLASLVLFSCKKNKDQPATPDILLTETENAYGVTKYTYDSQNRLVKYAYTDNTDNTYNRITTVTKFNSAGRVEEVLIDYFTSVYTKIVYSYDASGRIEKEEYYSINGAAETHLYDYLYHYTTGKTSISLRNIASGSTVLQNEFLFDANGNYSQVKYYNSTTGTLLQTIAYNAWDDKKSPNSLLPPAIAGILASNNFLGTTSTLASSGSVLNTTYTYEYNADGYPVRSNVSSSTGTNTVYYTYEKR